MKNLLWGLFVVCLIGCDDGAGDEAEGSEMVACLNSCSAEYGDCDDLGCLLYAFQMTDDCREQCACNEGLPPCSDCGYKIPHDDFVADQGAPFCDVIEQCGTQDALIKTAMRLGCGL